MDETTSATCPTTSIDTEEYSHYQPVRYTDLVRASLAAHSSS